MARRSASTVIRNEQQLRTTATRLRIGIGAFRRRAHEVKADGDLGAPQLAALSRLERDGPMSTAELARREQVSPQGMGAVMASLEEREMIARRPDPTDGRRSIMRITPAGLEAMHAGRSALVDNIVQALSQSFSADEIATLDAAGELLERLARHL